MKWITDIDLKVGGTSVTIFPFAQETTKKQMANKYYLLVARIPSRIQEVEIDGLRSSCPHDLTSSSETLDALEQLTVPKYLGCDN